MSNVEFEENSFSKESFRTAIKGGLITRLLFKYGVVKSEKEANLVLIAIAVCALILTFFVVKNSSGFGVSARQNVVPLPGAIPGGENIPR